MKIVGLRTYSVTTAELPLEIEVTAFRLPVNRAIVGHPRVSRSGVLLERLVPEVVDDLANVAIRYEIPLPAATPAPFDITQTIDCWFADNCPADAKYQILIRSKNGDQASTNVRVPGMVHGRIVLPRRRRAEAPRPRAPLPEANASGTVRSRPVDRD